MLFKGPDTVIADPDGRCAINSAHYERAAPWLATAGSGDVLTGLIAGLLAQFPNTAPEEVAAAAVYLHALAGEHAAERLGEQGMLATDILAALPAAIREVHG